MKLNLPNLFGKKGRGNKNSGLKMDSSQMTSILLVVIVVLVIYFIFLDDKNASRNLPYVAGGVGGTVGLDDYTRLGGGAGVMIDDQRAAGGAGGMVGLGKHYGAGAGAGVMVDRNRAVGGAGGLVGLGENRGVGVGGGAMIDGSRAVGGAAMGVQMADDDTDVLYAKGVLNYDKKYGAKAGIGFDDDFYGVSTGYNSKNDKLYLDIGELENFENHGNGKVVPKKGNCAVVFFFADWCGHCKRFQPTWNQFKNGMENKPIDVVEVSADNAAATQHYNVSGYPTVISVDSHGNKKSEFKGERTVSNLNSFANHAMKY